MTQHSRECENRRGEGGKEEGEGSTVPGCTNVVASLVATWDWQEEKEDGETRPRRRSSSPSSQSS